MAFSLNDVMQAREEVNNTNTQKKIKVWFVIHVQQLNALQKKQNNTIYHHMYLQCSKYTFLLNFTQIMYR